jgi:CheY-like chemotaxis protein
MECKCRAEEEGMKARGPSFPGLRVLVVEDEAFIAMELEEMLHELRCEIIATASTVDDALAYARRGGIDGALLDLNLHGDSVLPVADELAGSAVSFILLTGYSLRESDPPLLREARRVSKPFSLSILSAAIGETLLR